VRKAPSMNKQKRTSITYLDKEKERGANNGRKSEIAKKGREKKGAPIIRGVKGKKKSTTY